MVGVYSASQKIMALYVDGKEVAHADGGDFAPLGVTSVPLRVGADPTGDNRFLGHIQRAAIYGRALSPAEIAQRAAGPTALGGVLAEWQFGADTPNIIQPVAGTLPLRLTGGHVNIQGTVTAPAEPLTLWYARPATQWLEALPIGNGRLGAMVFGGVDTETLQLNEDSVWAGGPHDYDNPEALAALPEIRQLVFDGKFDEAQALVNAHFMGRPAGQAPYQTVGNLTLTLPPSEAVSDYRRELDLTTAVTHVAYTVGGVRHTREVFASHPDQVIVIRLTADRPGSVSFAATFDSPQKSATVSVSDPHTLSLNGVSGNAGGRRAASSSRRWRALKPKAARSVPPAGS